MKDKEKSYDFDFLENLTLVFIVLKLLGKIAWSWWWVLSPLWIPIALALVYVVIFKLRKKRG